MEKNTFNKFLLEDDMEDDINEFIIKDNILLKESKDEKTDAKLDEKTDAKPDEKTDAKPDEKTDAKPDEKTDAKNDIKLKKIETYDSLDDYIDDDFIDDDFEYINEDSNSDSDE